MERHLADVITYAKFQDEIFRGYNFTGGRISHFSYSLCMGLTRCYKTERFFTFIFNMAAVRQFVGLFERQRIWTI